MSEEELSFSLSALSFLEIKAFAKFLKGETLPLKGYELPDTSYLLNQEKFGEISMGWNLEGLYFLVDVKTKKIQSSYPYLEKGDSFEVMLDLRNVKSAWTTKFCHHFFFLVEPVEEVICGEKTQFRTEESHELASQELFVIDTKTAQGRGYQMRIFIPKTALFGFDPQQFKEIGFNYRLNRYGGASQDFSASSSEFPVEKHPCLWSHLQLEGTYVS